MVCDFDVEMKTTPVAFWALQRVFNHILADHGTDVNADALQVIVHLQRVEMYSDGSGYDFNRYATDPVEV